MRLDLRRERLGTSMRTWSGLLGWGGGDSIARDTHISGSENWVWVCSVFVQDLIPWDHGPCLGLLGAAPEQIIIIIIQSFPPISDLYELWPGLGPGAGSYQSPLITRAVGKPGLFSLKATKTQIRYLSKAACG